jgi:hypothetical protein
MDNPLSAWPRIKPGPSKLLHLLTAFTVPVTPLSPGSFVAGEEMSQLTLGKEYGNGRGTATI